MIVSCRIVNNTQLQGAQYMQENHIAFIVSVVLVSLSFSQVPTVDRTLRLRMSCIATNQLDLAHLQLCQIGSISSISDRRGCCLVVLEKASV